jgi:hypothetical protein
MNKKRTMARNLVIFAALAAGLITMSMTPGWAAPSNFCSEWNSRCSGDGVVSKTCTRASVIGSASATCTTGNTTVASNVIAYCGSISDCTPATAEVSGATEVTCTCFGEISTTIITTSTTSIP